MRTWRKNNVVVAAAVLVLGTTSVAAVGRSGVPSRGGSRAPSNVVALSAPPWASVGPGWLVAQWWPSSVSPHSYLLVVSPRGNRYVAQRLPQNTDLWDWSGDGQRALLEQVVNGRRNTARLRFETLAVRTGSVVQSFTIPSMSGEEVTAAFTRPEGLALYALGTIDRTPYWSLLTRYSLGGETLERYALSFGSAGRFSGAWLSSPDGAELVMGGFRGLALVSNDGTLIAPLPSHRSTQVYDPLRWWTPSVVLARCVQSGRLYLFPLSGATPRLLRVPPRGLTYTDAWRFGSTTYVQVSGPKDRQFIAKLRGSTLVPIRVPGDSARDSVAVLSSTASALALAEGPIEPIYPGITTTSVLWFTPATGSFVRVLSIQGSRGYLGEVVVNASSTT